MPNTVKPDDSDELDTNSEDQALSDDVIDDIDEESDDADSEAEDAGDSPDEDKSEDKSKASAAPEANDPPTDKAVDDIVKKESDEVLASEDAELNKAFDNQPESWKQKLKRLYFQWWNNKKLRYGTLAGLVALIFLLLALPPSRYFMLNTAGVRSSASISIFDQSTHQPIKNVEVTLGKSLIKTDDNGTAHFTKVRLGRQSLLIQKRAFAAKKTAITIGWGSNLLGNAEIQPVGAQYTFNVVDWLSGKGVSSAAASSGEFDASADDQGKIVLTIDANSDDSLDVTIKADNYRDQVVKLDVSNKAQVTVKMVPNRKSVFVSKRNGTYDVYKVDIDGNNEQLVLAGTGREKDDITLLSHPTDETAALVSSRDDVRDKDGYLLSTLTIINIDDNTTTSVAQSEEIRLTGWSDDSLIYVQIAAGASAANPQRQQLISYNYKTKKKIVLANSNNFNDVQLIGTTVYYAPGNLYNTDAVNGVYKQEVNGNSKSSILNQEAWNIFRSGYDSFDLSVDQDWYQYKLGQDKASHRSTPPSNLENRKYVDSADGKNSLWTDQRDGKGTLLLYDLNSKTDKVLLSQAGLQTPVRWLNNSVVIYRVQTPTETADYALSIEGGKAMKIRDVTPTQ